MDTHLLRSFVAVVRAGSFSAAARTLGYTQAAVSQQVAALERDLGTRLLHRRPVTPTTAGARLLEHAEPLLLRLDAARADVTRLAGTPARTLTVAASPLAAAHAVAALTRLCWTMPAPELTVRITPRERVAAQAATGGCDLGLLDGVAAPTDPLRLTQISPLSVAVVAEQPLVVVLPAGHPWAGRTGLRLDDLQHARWIDAPQVAPPLGELRGALGSDGFTPAVHYDGTDTCTLLALAAAGHGLTLLPRTAAAGAPAAVPVVAPRLVHRVDLVHGSLGPGTPAETLAAALRARHD